MKSELLSEDQVKQILGVDNFRKLSKEKVIEFVSLIPQMREDVAIKCIEQFPNFKDFAGSMIERLYLLCDQALKEDAESSIGAYRKILDELDSELKKDRITKRDRQEIIEKMVIIADKIAVEEDKKRQHSNDVINAFIKAGIIVLAMGASLIGLKTNPFTRK